MLYLLAGASRSRKDIARSQSRCRKQIPYFPLDVLFGAIVHGIPEVGLKYEDSLLDRPKKYGHWPPISLITF